MKNTGNEYDAIVVGSGPGGATVARELSSSGKKVLILEWGDNDPVKGTFRQLVPRALIPGKGLLITSQLLQMVRGITTGGSSLLYCATAFDPPANMLEAYGVDISNEVSEVKTEIPLAPLPDELISPAGKVFMQSALDSGYGCTKINKFIFANECRPNCQLCSYGCPHGAKWNARNFVAEALNNGAEIQNHANVSRVLVQHNKAVGVEYRRNRTWSRAFAKTIVVSAGGIGSPLILRRSGIRNVGHDFFFDPLQIVCGTVASVDGAKGVPMCTGIHFEEDGIVMTDMNFPQLLKIMFDLERLRFGKAFAFNKVLPVMVKIRDDLGGYLTDRGSVRKRVTKKDKLVLAKGVAIASKILKNAGATDIYSSWMIAAHPGGTVKIGQAVDQHLKTEYDNLYVCDCSVIPEAWGVPPTLTLLSLGKRLAKHLLGIQQDRRKQDAAPESLESVVEQPETISHGIQRRTGTDF